MIKIYHQMKERAALKMKTISFSTVDSSYGTNTEGSAIVKLDSKSE